MGLFDKFIGREYDDDYDDYDDYDDEEETRGRFSKSDSREVKQPAKVTPMHSAPQRKIGPGREVCVVKPSTYEDAREITETLLNGRTVVLNLEGLNVDIAQRIIDFTSGSTFAIDGNLQKISQYIFVVTPKSVDISGDVTDMALNGSIGGGDVLSVTKGY